jgi:hypothetical protein
MEGVVMDLDDVIEQLIATCGCPACHRYRIATAARIVFCAVKLEQSMGRKR